MKQLNFDSTVDQISRKPQSLISQDDARVVQSTEVSWLIPIFVKSWVVNPSLSRVVRSTDHPVSDLYPRRCAPLPIGTTTTMSLRSRQKCRRTSPRKMRGRRSEWRACGMVDRSPATAWLQTCRSVEVGTSSWANKDRIIDRVLCRVLQINLIICGELVRR